MAESKQETMMTNEHNLNEIFISGLGKMNLIEQSNLPFNSTEYQDLVTQAISDFEDATRIVSLAGVFSSNEAYEEIVTEHIKYLLLPFFLGSLINKTNKDREVVLDLSEVYYKDFLKRCEEYEIFTELFEQTHDSIETVENSTGIISSAIVRNHKIRRFQMKKEIESDLKAHKFCLNNLCNLVDEDVRRECVKKYLKKCILEAKEEIDNIKLERPLLEMRKNMNSQNSKSPTILAKSSKTGFKPIIIARDVEQKAVYGLGYPSIPVMTVREFYEERVAQGIFPNAEQVVKMNKLLDKHHQDLTQEDDLDQVEKEILIENDNEEYLAQQRELDDYRDSVRRGDGNRHNRS